MEMLIYIFIGLCGGIFGGLGMGGGTLLIPLLVLFGGVNQHVAQTINLVAFVPMAVVALCIHIKNRLVKFQYLLTVSLPATAVSICTALWAKQIAPAILGKAFGIFLLLLGLVQLVTLLYRTVRDCFLKKARSFDAQNNNLPAEPDPDA